MAKENYLHIRCEKWELDVLQILAEKENRSRSNLVMEILHRYIAEHWTPELQEALKSYPGYQEAITAAPYPGGELIPREIARHKVHQPSPKKKKK